MSLICSLGIDAQLATWSIEKMLQSVMNIGAFLTKTNEVAVDELPRFAILVREN